MSLREWTDLHGEDYPASLEREAPQRPLTRDELQFCFDELLGELGWDDDVAATGVDALRWARNEIKRLKKKQVKTNDRHCPACHALLEDHSVYCDNCGTDTPLINKL